MKRVDLKGQTADAWLNLDSIPRPRKGSEIVCANSGYQAIIAVWPAMSSRLRGGM